MVPNKVEFLDRLRGKTKGLKIPEQVYLSREHFEQGEFGELEGFLEGPEEIIVRSALMEENEFKGGTFSSYRNGGKRNGQRYRLAPTVETVKTLRGWIVEDARYAKSLAIRRQQKFNNAPEINPEDIGAQVMRYEEGCKIMAKQVREKWEFGYVGLKCPLDGAHMQDHLSDHAWNDDLVPVSERIQDMLGIGAEIEYIWDQKNDRLIVVQVKDITGRVTEAEPRMHDEDPVYILADFCLNRMRKTEESYRERQLFKVDDYEHLIPAISDRYIQEEGTFVKCLEEARAMKDEYERFALENEHYAVYIGEVERTNRFVGYVTRNHPDVKDFHIGDGNYGFGLRYCGMMYYPFVAEADTVINFTVSSITGHSHQLFGIDNINNPLWLLIFGEGDCLNLSGLTKGLQTGCKIGVYRQGEWNAEVRILKPDEV
ncbi:MAG: hypothetical protein KJ709_07555 [Nanoarchaeota archaeon]|nr:hypothetical protein [Nanoarchaeota archaeon]